MTSVKKNRVNLILLLKNEIEIISPINTLSRAASEEILFK